MFCVEIWAIRARLPVLDPHALSHTCYRVRYELIGFLHSDWSDRHTKELNAFSCFRALLKEHVTALHVTSSIEKLLVLVHEVRLVESNLS